MSDAGPGAQYPVLWRRCLEIDNQDAPAHSRQRRAEIDGGRCLPDPALLVHDCKDSRFTADHA